MTGTGAHGFDQIQWALDMDHTGPVEIWSEGGKLEPVVYDEAGEPRAGRSHCAATAAASACATPTAVEIRLEDNGPAAGGEFIGDEGKIRIGNNTVDSNPERSGRDRPRASRSACR